MAVSLTALNGRWHKRALQAFLVVVLAHWVEHIRQALTHLNLFGAAVPTSILQLVFPRVELHLFYNAVVFTPMLVAMWYHLHPTATEADMTVCGCALHHAPEAMLTAA